MWSPLAIYLHGGHWPRPQIPRGLTGHRTLVSSGQLCVHWAFHRQPNSTLASPRILQRSSLPAALLRETPSQVSAYCHELRSPFFVRSHPSTPAGCTITPDMTSLATSGLCYREKHNKWRLRRLFVNFFSRRLYLCSPERSGRVRIMFSKVFPRARLTVQVLLSKFPTFSLFVEYYTAILAVFICQSRKFRDCPAIT